MDPARLVATLSYKPGWVFKVGGPGGAFLCVFARTADSLRPESERLTQHMFRFPEGPVTVQGFARWVFACLMQAEFHEAAEFLQVDGFRPFFPHHQDDGSPYVWVERWPDEPPGSWSAPAVAECCEPGEGVVVDPSGVGDRGV